MKRWRYFIPLGLLLCVILIFVFYPTDEKRIRKVINKSERAVVAENLNELMKYISYNYRDDYGNGYLQVKHIMQSAFKQLNDIEIEKDIIKISVNKPYAEAEISVRVLASEDKDRGYIIGDAGRAEIIKVFLEKSPHRWLITKVGGLKVFEGSKI